MRRSMLLLLFLAACFGVLQPSHAAAQCHQKCVLIFDANGNVVGRGCVVDLDFFTTCLATATICIQDGCSGTFVTDANGAVLAEADICRDKVTLRPVTRPDSRIALKPDRRKTPKPQAATE